MFGKRVKLRKRILNRSTNKHDEQTFALPPRKIVFHAFRAPCAHIEVNSMEGSPSRIRHRSDPSEHSDWPLLRFSFRRFRSDPTSWKEARLLLKKTDQHLALPSHRRIPIGITVFFHFTVPFFPKNCVTRRTPKFPQENDPATIMLCFNREFVIYGDVTFVWKIFYYRRCNDIKVLILRYYWIELSTIEREIRKESVSVLYNTECKILRVICNDTKH